jgi:Zn-dependent peptidase ImmA (M78 family)
MVPESKAVQLLEELGLTTLPINPFEIAITLDAPVKELDLGKSCEGFLVIESTNAFIGLNSQIKSDKRKSFTVAHELGHLCMDVALGKPQKIVCQASDIGSYKKGLREIEVRANKFASELLMPRNLVFDMIRGSELGWTGIDQLASAAMVSRTAAAQKFIQLTEEACALVVSQNRQLQWFKASPSFTLFFNSDSRGFMGQSIADKIFLGEEPEPNFEEVPASTWLRGRSSNLKDAVIQEWSLPLNSHGQVLTVLWDDTGISDDADEEDSDEEDEESAKIDPNWGWETPTFSKKRRR